MKQDRSRVFTSLTAILISLAANPGGSVSTVTHVTKENLADHPFDFKVVTEERQDGSIKFTIGVSPKQDRHSWCVRGGLSIGIREERVGSFVIAEDGESIQFPSPEWRWTYSFTINPKYLDGSRFTFADAVCTMPSVDWYSMSLDEFHEP